LDSVLEQNPPKQGLKPFQFLEGLCKIALVLEQNPPKQGLKHDYVGWLTWVSIGFRAKSTKTRIETSTRKPSGRIRFRF